MNAPWMMNKRMGADSNRDPYAAFVSDDGTASTLRMVAAEMGWPADRINKGGVRNAVQTLGVSASPSILLIDLTEAHDPLMDINSLAEVCEPGTIVIALGETNDVSLYRELIASGIQDYLLKPVSPDLLRESLMQAQSALHAPKQETTVDSDAPRAVVAVIGVRGGVGASTVASSMAWMLSQDAKRKTALLDLDLQFGTGALAFDLEPGRGLTDALENPSRVDSLFIDRATVKANDRLAVLSAEASITVPLTVDGTALQHLETELCNSFEAIVIDMPRQVLIQNPHLLHEVTDIVIVTELNLACTRDTIRFLGFLKAAANNIRLHIVCNKVQSGQPGPEVSKRDFESSIERAADFFIPYDAKGATTAARQGKTLSQTASDSKSSAALRALVSAVTQSALGDAPAKPGLKDMFANLKTPNLGALFQKKG
jgi:pilus assembly protein CpaE